MKPIRFASANINFGKPANWDESVHGPCGVLPVYADGDANTCQSVWKATWRERLQILLGAKVVLTVNGRQPPVALEVERIAEMKPQPASAG